MSEITVAFAIYCGECGSDVRTATSLDHQGDIVDCPVCQSLKPCLVGLRVRSVDDDARERVKLWMENNAYSEDVLAEVLSRFHRRRKD